MHKKNIKIDTRTVVGVAVFSALAFVLSLVIRFPVMFLTFDVKDAIICTSAFIYGPIAAPIVALLTALLELITNISGTGLYGFLMNFLSSAALSTVASLVYRKWRTLNGAIVSMLAAVIAMVAVMMGANLLITPYYMTGGSVAAVAKLIPSVLLPFNLAKGLLNAAITLLIYKPIKIAMKRAGLLSKEKATGKTLAEEFRFTRSTGVILVCAIFMIALSVILFYMLLH
ncbi:MAG: ECF transporter S component [Clostridia bacterium]|nr:ECF transporter S component [Clostridia bacterium]